MIWLIPTMWQFPELFLWFCHDFQNPGHTLLSMFLSIRPMGMVGEGCLPSNAYYPQMPDYTLYSGVDVCWSEHSDLSFVYVRICEFGLWLGYHDSNCFYFILILFNLLAKAVLRISTIQIILRKIKTNNISYGQWRKILPFFLSFFLPLRLNFFGGHRRCTLYIPGCRMKAYKKPI